MNMRCARPSQQAMSLPSVVEEGVTRNFDHHPLADLRSWHAEDVSKDCSLICENSPNTHVKMSSSVLSMRSPMLKRMLLSDFKEAKEKVIKVRAVDVQCFEQLVQYFLGYLPQFNEDLDQTIQLYIAAHYYLMDDLRKICLNVLVDKVHVNNVCQLTRLIAVYKEPKLKSAIKKCFIADKIRIRSCNTYKALWKEHTDLMVHLLTEEKLLIIGGSYNDEGWKRRSRSVLAFNPSTGRLTPYRKSLTMPRERLMAGKYYGEKIIICGGLIGDSYTATNNVEIIGNDVEPTVQGPSMNVKRRNAGGAVLGEHFYVFGGRDENGQRLSSCECYSFETNRWVVLKQMPVALSSCSAVAHADNIYIIGGLDRNSKDCNSMYRYNTLICQWKSMKSMRWPRYSAGCTLRQGDNKILVTGGYGWDDQVGEKCEQYDVENDTWKEVAEMKATRSGHVLIDFNDTVYAIGGSGKRSVEKWDENSGHWQTMLTDPLPHWLDYFSAVVF